MKSKTAQNPTPSFFRSVFFCEVRKKLEIKRIVLPKLTSVKSTKTDSLSFLATEDLRKHRPFLPSILKDRHLQNSGSTEADSYLDGRGCFGLDYKMCRLQYDN